MPVVTARVHLSFGSGTVFHVANFPDWQRIHVSTDANSTV
ncbi:hypothetical protein N184_12690 [Sinorhizobium sp. GL28]|nr:hypothetical protein N184_12690 [Sinorhizobium sp. GL28]